MLSKNRLNRIIEEYRSHLDKILGDDLDLMVLFGSQARGEPSIMIPDIEALMDKAEKSLGAARSLIEDNDFEFAASRDYYAMFYVAEALLASIGQSCNKPSAVISAFGREYAKTGKFDTQYHRWLIDAQDLRNIWYRRSYF